MDSDNQAYDSSSYYKQNEGFHWQNGIFFRRLSDGSVRIRKYIQNNIEFEFIISADSWASIVSSVSKGGETHNRFYAARDFHASEGSIVIKMPRPDTTVSTATANQHES